jgi:hypothetical protein
MAWLEWLTGKKNPQIGQRAAHSDVLSSQQMDHSRSMMGRSGHAQPAVAASSQRLEQRRSERNAKRELLFQVVRESMVRVGVLSSAFKFKVLSLDQRGRSFLVMIELSAEFSGEVEKLAEIEAMIAQTAKHRFEVIVQAVYWRYFNSTQQTAASAPAPLLGALQSPTSRPAPLFAMPNGQAGTPAASHTTAARASAVDPHSVTSSIPIIGATANQLSASRATAAQAADDLGDDEVAAFRRALAAGASQGAMAAAAPKAAPAAKAPAMPAPPPASSTRPLAAKPIAPASTLETARSKLLLTGYEDTEMADDDPLPALSGTQYGELR